MSIFALSGSAFAKLELNRGHWIGGFLLAVLTQEVEVFALSLLHADAMASAVLPNVTLLAGDTMCAIVEVVSMDTTNRAIKVPFVVLLEIVQLSLPLLHVCLQLALRQPRASCFGIEVIRFDLLQ